MRGWDSPEGVHQPLLSLPGAHRASQHSQPHFSPPPACPPQGAPPQFKDLTWGRLTLGHGEIGVKFVISLPTGCRLLPHGWTVAVFGLVPLLTVTFSCGNFKNWTVVIN